MARWTGGSAGKKKHTLLPLGALCVSVVVWEREMSAFGLQHCLSVCLLLIAWLVSAYPASCLQLGLNSTAKISCLVARYHSVDLYTRAYLCMCALKCYHQALLVPTVVSLQTVSPSYSSIVAERIPPNHHHHLHLFTHLLPFSFFSCFHSPNYPHSSKWPLLRSLWSYFSANST